VNDFGDAPDGNVAYPSLAVNGQFPTCITVGPSAWVEHGLGWAHFSTGGAPQPAWDAEIDGDAGLCPGCFPTYDDDECFADGDAGLIMPEPYTIIQPAAGGPLQVVTCPGSTGTALGQTCTMAVWGANVDIMINNGMPCDGYLNVLADWDQGGTWGGSSQCPTAPASEHVVINHPVPQGFVGAASTMAVPPPMFLIGPNAGYVWFRFSITESPVTAGWDGSGQFEDGESEDYLLLIDQGEIEPKALYVPHSKWSQPPIEIDSNAPNIVYCGWDELSSLPPDTGAPYQLVADDYRCIGDIPVTSVHWWGSHIGWDTITPPPNEPNGWAISFWTNIPAGVAAPYSMPGNIIHHLVVDASKVQSQYVGMDYYPDPYIWPETCYQYNVDLDPCDWFWQDDFAADTQNNIYWISIAAIYPPDIMPKYPWGWKTRPWHWMDDAVRITLDTPPAPGMTIDPIMVDPITDPCLGESMDVAFELDTDPCWIKWEQLYTGIRDWPHYEDYLSMLASDGVEISKWWQGPDLSDYGLDVDATNDPCNLQLQPQLIADDFRCDLTGAITTINVWGSWLYDELPFQDANAVKFTLSIHNDNPMGSQGWSEPNDLLWIKTFRPGEFQVIKYAWDLYEGYYSPCNDWYEQQGDSICWLYHFPIDASHVFTQEKDNIYWLDVQAEPCEPYTRFGWKTSYDHWNDDGVWADGNEMGHGPWTELRYPRNHPLDPCSIDLAFEIFTTEQQEPELLQLVADDWKCERQTPVIAVVWWGSYLEYTYQACDVTGSWPPPPVKPDCFELTIWTDTPAGDPTNPYPYSHPNEPNWTYRAYDYDEVLVGYDKYPHGPDQQPPYRTEPVFRYSVRLPEDDWFCQKEVNDIYWLSVVAVYEVNQPNYDWGWTNHEYVDIDDAVAGTINPTDGSWEWWELYDQTGVSCDMSFMLFTEPGCFPCCHPDYWEWRAVGKPNCWCCPTQCHGDADCAQEKIGPKWYSVAYNDLGILVGNWKSNPPGEPGICADFSHSNEKIGPKWYRVAYNDLGILVSNWKSNPAPDCLDCP